MTSLFIYKWAKELIGPNWALIPFFLFSLSPLVLAHGHYVTTDIAAALGFLIGLYYFLKFLEKPNNKNVLKAGIALGIALLMKFSVFFLLPVMAVIYLTHLAFKRNLKYFLYSLTGLTLTFLLAFLTIYLVYFHHTFHQPLQKSYRDASIVLSSFAGGPDPQMATCHKWVGLKRQMRCAAEIDLKLFRHRTTLPIAQYLLGLIMTFQRSIGGNTAYFLGYVNSSGWWFYFPIVFLLKEPLPSLILIFLAILITLFVFIKKRKFVFFDKKFHNPALQQWSMLFLVLAYWTYSIKGKLDIGLRHILPTLPFIYILTAASLREWFKTRKRLSRENRISRTLSIISREMKTFAKYSLLGILLLWFLAETISVAPQFIAYFNQLAGGPANGYKYVVDSNLDWGQDLKRLALYTQKNHIKDIKLDYFGWADPRYYLKSAYHPWSSYKGKPNGYFAVSLTFLQGAKGKLWPGQRRRPQDEYRWLKDPYHPYKRIGYSIFVYKF